MKLIRFIILFVVLFLPSIVYATVDFLSVNKITKEYYWRDEDHSTGWIGWTSVPEGELETAEENLIELGYTKTSYPYKIETFIALLVGLMILGLYVVRRRARQ